jgi:phosphohistidine phosphatase SixA
MRRRSVGNPRLTILLFAAALGLAALPTRATAQTVIYLVRHAEPTMAAMGTDRDPELNLAGQERAHALRHLLEQAGITEILSTDFNRTRQTVTPLADALGLPVKTYDYKDLPGLADRLKHTPGRFLVAGHSNTTPEMVKLLGGDPGAPINEDYEFDRLYQVVVDSDGSVITTLLRYGAVSGR